MIFFVNNYYTDRSINLLHILDINLVRYAHAVHNNVSCSIIRKITETEMIKIVVAKKLIVCACSLLYMYMCVALGTFKVTRYVHFKVKKMELNTSIQTWNLTAKEYALSLP